MSEYSTYIEIAVKVDYDYNEGEEQVLYPNDKAHPGSDDSITINSVEVDGLDIYEHLTGGDQQTLMDDIMESLIQGSDQ